MKQPAHKWNVMKGFSAIAQMMGLAKEADFRLLNQYILSIHQIQDLDDILAEVSECLGEMLDYRLFAFVIRDTNGVDVWIDPSIFRDSFAELITEDLALAPGEYPNFIGRGGPSPVQEEIRREDLSVRTIEESGFTAKLYLVPRRKMLSYHDEILETILSTLQSALSNRMRIRQLEGAVAEDGLTGCYNRREFDRQIERQVANANRYGKSLSLVMFDLDHFKQVNDTYGHPAGDAVLAAVSEAIRNEIRTGDSLCRYGGEEFAIILPETPLHRAVELSDRLRRVVADLMIPAGEETLQVTASFGVAAAQGTEKGCDLVGAADAMLYAAKKAGRNCVKPA